MPGKIQGNKQNINVRYSLLATTIWKHAKFVSHYNDDIEQNSFNYSGFVSIMFTEGKKLF